MSTGLGVRTTQTPTVWPVWFVRNFIAGCGTLIKPPAPGAHRAVLPARSRLVWWSLASVCVVALAMVLIDVRTIGHIQQLPFMLVVFFSYLTDLGLSGWFLYPLGVMLLLIAAANSPKAPRYTRDTLTALSIRISFLFAAIAVPGLSVAIIKRLIGRARPFVEGHDTFAYQLFVWRADYASFPSGHATTAFATAVAIGAMWPKARAVMFIYAVSIAVSRVIVGAHHPSDVIAGAIFGTVGALLVRNWFIHRRLAFVANHDGDIRRLPWPAWSRLTTTARRITGFEGR